MIILVVVHAQLHSADSMLILNAFAIHMVSYCKWLQQTDKWVRSCGTFSVFIFYNTEN